eukprot:296110_1
MLFGLFKQTKLTLLSAESARLNDSQKSPSKSFAKLLHNSKSIMSIFTCADHKYDHLDKRTFIIVRGYIKDIETSLCYLCPSSLNQIPSEVMCITLDYIDDHFMLYRGSYQWTIDGHQLRDMLNSQVGQYFTSDVFKIGNLQWTLSIHPNGHNLNDIGEFYTAVTLLSLPITWGHIDVAQSIIINETNTKVIAIAKYHHTQQCSGTSLLLNEIVALSLCTLTIDITIKILRIVANPKVVTAFKDCILYQSPINHYRRRYQFDFVVDKSRTSNWNKTDVFQSDVDGDIFSLLYKPRESNVSLHLLGLPNEIDGQSYFVDALQIKWTLKIAEMEVNVTGTAKLNYINFFIILPVPSLTLEKFRECDVLTFCSTIEILNEYDVSGNVIGMDIMEEWDKYMVRKLNQNIVGYKDETLPPSIQLRDTEISEEDEKDDMGHGIDEIKAEMWKELRRVRTELEEIKCNVKEIKKYYVNDDHEREAFRLWLQNEVKLMEYYEVLIQNGFDNLNAMKMVGVKELEEIGIHKMGHRYRLLYHIKKLDPHTNGHSVWFYVLLALTLTVVYVSVRIQSV